MKRRICFCLGLFVLNLLFGLEIPYSTTPVKTDTNLFEDFVRVDPDDSKPETLKTRCWLWYDENALHAEFEAEIDSTFTKGNYYPKDSNYDGDFVRIQLITIPEAYYAYYYLAPPMGNYYDGIRNTDMDVDTQWNSSYTFTTEHTDSLWTTHIVMPFKEMRFNARPPYNWKVIFTRYNKHAEEFYSKPYANTIAGKGYFGQGADITLTHQIKRSSDLKFKPYFVKSYDLLNRTATYDPDNLGMDISFNPGTKTKLKIAWNPDFSDIPPDNAQNDYNRKNPPWYSENRYFFTEDLDAFGVDYSTFYTRHIVQPQIAVKLTGNSKTLNYGFLGAKDRKIASNGYVINEDDYYQLASVIRTLPRFKTIVSTASRMNEDYYNHLGILYWNWEFVKEYHIGQSGIYSYKHPRPEDNMADLSDYMYSVFFKGDPGNWDFTTKYINIGKDFRADMGTFYDTGYEGFNYDASWSSDTKDQYIKQWGFSSNSFYQRKLDADRTLQYTGNYLNAWCQFKPKYSFSLNTSEGSESNLGKVHDLWSVSCNGSWYQWEKLGGYIYANYGKELVYNLNKSYKTNNVSGNIWGKVGQNLDWSVNLTHYDYDYPRRVILYTVAGADTVINDNHYQIGSAYLNFNINHTMTLRNGLSLTSNDAYGYFSRISFYSNFRYEFKKDCFLYAGYKTGQAQDEQSVWKDPMGHFKRNSASAYMKVSLTL